MKYSDKIDFIASVVTALIFGMIVCTLFMMVDYACHKTETMPYGQYIFRSFFLATFFAYVFVRKHK